eukprot:809487-Rhodomonas_salina.2
MPESAQLVTSSQRMGTVRKVRLLPERDIGSGGRRSRCRPKSMPVEAQGPARAAPDLDLRARDCRACLKHSCHT